MRKQIVASLLVGALSFSAMANTTFVASNDGQMPISDFKMIINEDCRLINPVVINYLRESDYIPRKTRNLELSIKYNQESEEAFKELRDDAAQTATVSRVLMGASLVLLSIVGPKVSTSSGGGVVTGAFNTAVKVPEAITEFIVKGGPTVRIVAGSVFFQGLVLSLAGAAYLGYVEPFVAVYQYKMRNVKSQKEVAAIFASLSSDFKNAQQKLDDLRSEVDLDYSRVMNSLTLGGKAKDATEQLYAISAAKTLLYQAELELMNKLEDKVHSCR